MRLISLPKVSERSPYRARPDEKNTETKADKAQEIIRKYMLGAGAAGLVPVPFADIAAISGIQLRMLERLANLYDVRFSEHLASSLIASLLGGIIPLSFSCNLVCMIPIYGLAAGVIGKSFFGGASTYAIGKVFVQHFESGGTFLTFDPEQVRDYYNQQFGKGKTEVKKSFVGVKP